MNPHVTQALLKTLAFHEAWRHYPTRAEWLCTLEWEGEETLEHAAGSAAIDALVERGTVLSYHGRYALPLQGVEHIQEQRRNELWQARKLRAARRVARWLARLSSVRFVALCNTTALGHARDEADLDFFVIARSGTLMVTRALAVLPYKLRRQRPGEQYERDAVCLSYFVSDDGLDLSAHMLTPDDPYFRYWFLSLLPLYDDGILEALWTANVRITGRHPFARPWIVSPDLRIETPRWRLPVPAGWEERAAAFQMRRFPERLHELMNRDTRVLVTPRVLKFHVDDRREEYRQSHQDICRTVGIQGYAENGS